MSVPPIEILERQRDALKQANNARFKKNGMEYRIKYEGGIADCFGVYGRPTGTRAYKYIAGFAGYKLYTKEQVIAMAKCMVK